MTVGDTTVNVTDSRAVVVLPQSVEFTDIALTDSTGASVGGRLYLTLRSAASQTVDKTNLKTFIDSANAIKKDGKTYTKASLEALDTALAAAQGVYDDEVAISSEVSAAGLALKNAVNGMKTHEHTYDKGKVTKEATATATGTKVYTCTECDATKTETLKKTVAKATVSKIAAQAYTGKAVTPSVVVKAGKTTLKSGTDYSVSYKNNVKVGTASVTITGKGDYTGTNTVTFAIQKKVTPVVTLKTKSYTFDGKVKKPAVTVKVNGKTMKSSTYTVTYSSNGRKIEGGKNIGVYRVTVTMKGSYMGSASTTFTINPKGTSLTSVGAAKAGFTAKWSKQTSAAGYQIQYSSNAGFKGYKVSTITKNSTVSARIAKLASNKTYYVRIRTYKKVAGKTYYSGWSEAKIVTTK